MRALIVPQPGHDSIARDPGFSPHRIPCCGARRTCRTLEGIGVEKELDPLAGGELAAVVLG